MRASDPKVAPRGQGVWPHGDTPPTPGSATAFREGIELVLCNNPSSWTFEGTNTWVISDGGRAMVLDPGPEDADHQRAVADWLTAQELEIEHILLSHGHFDHAGGSKPLTALAGGPGVTDLRGCEDGTPVSFGSGSDDQLLAIRTPGHTSDGISFLWPRHKVAFVGDTALARVNPYIHHPDGTVSDILDTMEKLADMVDDSWLVLTGHGPVIHHPRTHLHRRMDSRHRRIAEVRGHYEKGLGEEQIITAMYGDRGEQTRMAASATVRALLAHIIEERNNA